MNAPYLFKANYNQIHIFKSVVCIPEWHSQITKSYVKQLQNLYLQYKLATQNKVLSADKGKTPADYILDSLQYGFS